MTTPPRRARSRDLYDAAWPDMFTNLQTAYADLTRAQSELQRRAAEIEETRDLLQLVIESMSEALFLMDRAGRITRANVAAKQLLEVSEEQLIGKFFFEVCGSDEIPATAWQFLKRTKASTLNNLEVDVLTQSGHTIPVSASCGLVRDKRGKIVGMLVVLRDITERKKAEEALALQAEELSRSNADLEQFAYVASHDLQEPLRMMSSFAQLLALEYSKRLDAEADEYINYIVDGAGRMQRLINDLLAYSRVNTRGQPFEPIAGDVVVAEACRNLQIAIRESDAAIMVDTLPTIMGDQTQLVQLFQNLIGNAIKFRSELSVQIQVGAQRQGDEWMFWVRDNGIGIDPQFAERIFVLFQRLHTRAEYSGTGIGLAICKKIVERHGGRIWVEALPGQGSTFYFTLPVEMRAKS